MLMDNIFTILATLLALYGLVMSVFVVMENRRPQSTLAWMLVLFFVPGLGLLIYMLFGRDGKAFSKQSELLRQDLRANAMPLLSPILSRQDAELARLESQSLSHKKLAMLVRRNSLSALTTRNRVEIQQNAAEFYPGLIEDLKAARHSIHLQYFIWGVDPFTDLKQILIEKARAGVEVRLLYDPQGSQAHVGRRYVKEMLAQGIRMAATSPLYHLHTISYRNHRKITVIDGVIGYTGGMNIGQEHLDGGEGFDSWRDTQVRLVGESVAVLQAVFMVDWYNAVREGESIPCQALSHCYGGACRKHPGADPDLGTGFAVGGNQAALRSDGRLRAATRLSSITLLPSRRDPRRSPDRGGLVGGRCQGDGERAPVGQQTAGLGREHLHRGDRRGGRARVPL
jgi:cardiolipin synthase A/B